jgi:valyl-tRNA synthetase
VLEGQASIHATAWPASLPRSRDLAAEEQMELALEVLHGWRYVRSQTKLAPRTEIQRIDLDVPADIQPRLAELKPTLHAALRCPEISFGPGSHDAGREGWRFGVVFAPGEDVAV